MLVQRFDLASGEVTSHRKTAIGGLVARGNLTRTGVLTYKDPSMPTGVRRELRHPDDVFNSDSLDSLAHVPVTDDHPAGKVTTESWRDDAIGHIAGKPKRDGKFVAGELHINHGPAVDKAERGDLAELSCGYTCHYDATPGTYDGQAYDGRQTSIRYNHVAAGPVGWGRAGSEVRMRLDALGAEVSVSDARANEDSWQTEIQEFQNIMGISKDSSQGDFVTDENDARLVAAQRNRDRFQPKAKESGTKTGASDDVPGSSGKGPDEDQPDARTEMVNRNRDRFQAKDARFKKGSK
jgi:hypothetical protein